ncbi:MAG: hypothetical protein ABR540_13265, partial [Acidimicrobiales bacterium]
MVVGVVSTVVEVVEVVNAAVEVVLTVLVVVEVDVRLALPPATPAEASGMPPASKTTVTPTFAAANCRKRARFATAICPIGRAGRAGSSRPHVEIGHMSRRLEQKFGFFAKSGEARTLT